MARRTEATPPGSCLRVRPRATFSSSVQWPESKQASAQNRSNVEKKQQSTDHTRSGSSGQGQEKAKKRRLGILNLHSKRARNGLRAASEVLRRSLALLDCFWKRLRPLQRGLGEALGTSRGALGSVLGSSESVSETIMDGFWSSKEAA